MVNLHPTLCADLLPAPATYGGYCDASKSGAGGVWFGIDKSLNPNCLAHHFPTAYTR